MERIRLISIIIFFVFSFLTFSQTSTTKSSGSKSGTGTLGFKEDTSQVEDTRTKIASIISSSIGNKLRHPDPVMRKQALTYLISLLNSSGIFTSSSGVGSSGQGIDDAITLVGVNFISDLFLLLNDADPEVSDLARVALDVLFNTEDTFLKYMEDPDPLIRKYAIKIYTERCTTAKQGKGFGEGQAYSTQISALRTLLVRLKYEKDENLKRTLIDAIEQFLTTSKIEGGKTVAKGIDPSIIKYLDDPNPDVRRNALKVIASMGYNPEIFNVLLEKLKTEKDEDVKAAIERTIEVLSGSTEGR